MRPMISGSAGNSRSSSRARRIASSHSGARALRRAAARRIALVEHEIDHRGDGGEPLGALDRARRLERNVGLGDAAFARVMRCSIALSLTRNARAICFTVRPDTMRSASAICWVAGSSGWQQMNSRRRISSR